jgi:recombination protein RecA
MAKERNLTAAELIVQTVRKHAPKKEDAGIMEVDLASNNVLTDVRYILKTGIRAFDDIVGAFPFGRLVELFGLEACGKTAMCKHVALKSVLEGNVYKRTRLPDNSIQLERLPSDQYEITVLYLDNEGSLESDDQFPPNFIIGQAGTIEQVFKTLDLAMITLKGVEEKTKKLQLLVVVVDTIAGTASKEELAQEWGKDDYARQPKQLREGFRNMMQRINKQNVCMICTNQLSDKMGYVAPGGRKMPTVVPNSDQFSTFGGKATKYWSTWRTFMFQMPSKYVLVKKSQFQAGFVIHFKTEKNRLRKPRREGKLVLLFDEEQGGFRDDFSMLETMKYCKFVEEDSEGVLVFKFRKNKVPLTTFGDIGKSLEEMDESPEAGKGRYKDPRISSRSQWPSFYKEHQVDFDALWAKVVTYVFETQGINGLVETENEDDDDSAAEESVDVPRRKGGRRTLAALKEIV